MPRKKILTINLIDKCNSNSFCLSIISFRFMNYFIEFKMLVTNLMANRLDLDFLRKQCAATKIVQNVEEIDVDTKRILLERN